MPLPSTFDWRQHTTRARQRQVSTIFHNVVQHKCSSVLVMQACLLVTALARTVPDPDGDAALWRASQRAMPVTSLSPRCMLHLRLAVLMLSRSACTLPGANELGEMARDLRCRIRALYTRRASVMTSMYYTLPLTDAAPPVPCRRGRLYRPQTLLIRATRCAASTRLHWAQQARTTQNA